MGHGRRTVATLVAAVLMTLALPAAVAGAAEAAPRVDLRVLVVDDGGPAVEAVRTELETAGTPYTRVDLGDSARPRVDQAFLSDTVDGRARARYQGVVLPNDNPFGTGSPEMAALADYEKRFGIRQLDAYTYARPAVGLNTGWSGTLDGTAAQVTAAGATGPFGYLRKNVPFENNDRNVGESYGHLATPLDRQADGATFTPYVEAPVPGTGRPGSLIGQYTHDGRSELVVTFVYNHYQTQFRLLARGMVEWLTQGVHLGAARNYFALHVDDVFASDDRWDSQLNCTPGDVDCPPGSPENDPIRMTPADAQYARQWSRDHGLTLDLAFNGGGSESYKDAHAGSDPLAAQLLADQNAYRWINHTYNHPFLGCVQDTSVVPWRCATDAQGNVRWTGRAQITAQIEDNRAWAARNRLASDKEELVTGEHSGLRTLPQQPTDNPELAPALTQTGVTWLGSDTSREYDQRTLGPSLTVPRYPMNVFYNAGKAAEQVDEYNWIYTRKADGGSGLCESSANTTCLPGPLARDTGYTDYIVPLESRIALGHALANDPRPHFIHQSNLAEERIGYKPVEKLLADYRALFADSTPLVNLRMRDIGAELHRRTAWAAAVKDGKVTAHRIGDRVTVQAPAGVEAVATLPTGTLQLHGTSASVPFGGAYAGARSGWAAPAAGETEVALLLPGTTPSARDRAGRAARVQAPAPALPVPPGVSRRVPYGPGDTVRR
ncbi:hypothetical protein GCM10010218_45640 [Streptomyces mashuensis]|uniref:Secreted protein n=1 Tax=Streptomyces mashuensis TaxID=33904 RepID=A0A919EDU6_9ACTN|nr:hypothetical protein [Streptomyces mashuensis]GHF59098.1 hypothetical protein GCM10010218_45640 [Streptomyces mashuensis]